MLLKANESIFKVGNLSTKLVQTASDGESIYACHDTV
jgi:hypothetical protein